MHEFLTHNRSLLIARCQIKVAEREARVATDVQMLNGIPMFLDQLIRTLRIEQSAVPMESRLISGPASGAPALSEIGTLAAVHGRELLKLGFTIDQVVHNYGDLCQSVTDLAYESGEPFAVDEFRTLNRCLDNAIADAVTEFSYQRDFMVADRELEQANERLGVFAHELRNSLATATLAFTAARVGGLSLTGATGDVLERSLAGLGRLIARSLDGIRGTQVQPIEREMFSVSDFIDEVHCAFELEANRRGCPFVVSPVSLQLALRVDRHLLFGALTNLLQNAFKFTHGHTAVRLDVYPMGDRILMDVKDHCGGLAPGAAERMFLPFAQFSSDRSGLGLGLSIARSGVVRNGGQLSVRNDPGTGCVFTISLPRHTMAV